MRVIAGKHKGMVIPMPKKGTIRPTTDRSKEALFSIINSRYDLEECDVLDLFGGSGGVAFEFASRYTNSVVSVEMNRRVHKQCIEFARSKNIEDIQFICSDVFSFLKRNEKQFDIVFADPPYHLKNIKDIPDLVADKNVLKPSGVLIIEHHSTLQWDHASLIESRAYGQSVFSFFQFDVSLDND
jgi:16S rRNA (guanine(966)-N(2))-methyltransferase RsmD